jgi:hypothetical protein
MPPEKIILFEPRLYLEQYDGKYQQSRGKVTWKQTAEGGQGDQ